MVEPDPVEWEILTPRQRQVLRERARGATYREIAAGPLAANPHPDSKSSVAIERVRQIYERARRMLRGPSRFPELQTNRARNALFYGGYRSRERVEAATHQELLDVVNLGRVSLAEICEAYHQGRECARGGKA